jgi:hypothetical protein
VLGVFGFGLKIGGCDELDDIFYEFRVIV